MSSECESGMTYKDSSVPNLEQAFAMVVHWLDFDCSLSQPEAATLKSAFDRAVREEELIFVAASSNNIVVVNNHQAFCMEVPHGKKMWFREIAEEKEGLIFDREGLFLGNFQANDDLDAEVDDNSILGMLYMFAPDDMKMRWE